MTSKMLSLCSLALVLPVWCLVSSEQQRKADPVVRWISTRTVDTELVSMKKEITIDAETAMKVFAKESPYLRENWEKAIPGKIENAKEAQSIPDGVKKIWIESKDKKPHASVLQYSDKELIVVVVMHKGTYLWHQYYECLARLRMPRNKEIDAIFNVASLEKSYGAEYKGLRQGTPEKDVIDKLGKPDGRIGFQAGGYYKLCYFKDDVIVTITYGRIESIETGIPKELKEELNKNGGSVLRY